MSVDDRLNLSYKKKKEERKKREKRCRLDTGMISACQVYPEQNPYAGDHNAPLKWWKEGKVCPRRYAETKWLEPYRANHVDSADPRQLGRPTSTDVHPRQQGLPTGARNAVTLPSKHLILGVASNRKAVKENTVGKAYDFLSADPGFIRVADAEKQGMNSEFAVKKTSVLTADSEGLQKSAYTWILVL
ncbi:hypothetical protein B0H19DRAFT_1071558 [Mycena capillaripes]|nr:hypothetical protein B0H19DRAFT_1071558 [Mycena capillaripes]